MKTDGGEAGEKMNQQKQDLSDVAIQKPSTVYANLIV